MWSSVIKMGGEKYLWDGIINQPIHLCILILVCYMLRLWKWTIQFVLWLSCVRLSRDNTMHDVGLYVSLYSRSIQWHIHAGSWSLVNCWREGKTLPYIGCSWILMNAAVGHMNGSALMVIGVSAWYPDIPLSPWKKRLCLHAKKLLLEIYYGP